MRCISPHVGGGFGTKIFLYPEYVLVAALAEKLGRPVKWIESRRENYAATTHGRDHITYLEVGAKQRRHDHRAEGEDVREPRRRPLDDRARASRRRSTGGCSRAAYRIPAIHCQVIGVYTNTGMVDAYRGAGRPEATYVVERAVDLVARELGLDPVEVRRRNFIPPDAFPYDPGILAGLALRHRRLREGARPRARDRRLRRLPRRAGSRRGARGATSGSASRPTSRSAAWRRRRGSARPARAGAPASGRARTCAST